MPARARMAMVTTTIPVTNIRKDGSMAKYIWICLMIFPFVSAQAETDGGQDGPEIHLSQKGSALAVKEASVSEKHGSARLLLKLKRKDYTVLPTGSHVHVDNYDKAGEVLNSYVYKTPSHIFHRRPPGRYLAKYFHRNLGESMADLSKVEIVAVSGSHDSKCN